MLGLHVPSYKKWAHVSNITKQLYTRFPDRVVFRTPHRALPRFLPGMRTPCPPCEHTSPPPSSNPPPSNIIVIISSLRTCQWSNRSGIMLWYLHSFVGTHGYACNMSFFVVLSFCEGERFKRIDTSTTHLVSTEKKDTQDDCEVTRRRPVMFLVPEMFFWWCGRLRNHLLKLFKAQKQQCAIYTNNKIVKEKSFCSVDKRMIVWDHEEKLRKLTYVKIYCHFKIL